MSSFSDMATAKSSDVVRVTTDSDGNGVLRLRSYKTPVGDYRAPKSVTTSSSMTFLYGYLEVRAKVPTGAGLWPSLWTLAYSKNDNRTEETVNKLGYNPNNLFGAEVDIFEVYGSDYVKPALHKWWKKDSELFEQYGSRASYGGDTYSISDGGWHTYGMLWTPQEISLFVDDVCYMTYDLNVNFGPDEADMSGFHEPLFIIFNNHLFTPGYTSTSDGEWALKYGELPSSFSEAIYDIDYVRLYQKPETSKIYLAN